MKTETLRVVSNEDVLQTVIERNNIQQIPTKSSSQYWIDWVLRAAVLGSKYLIKEQISAVKDSVEARHAEELLYREYRAHSFCRENQSKRYYSIYTLLPTTHTLISRYKGRIVGTVSAIEDSILGLPIDLLYKQELDQLRNSGHNLIEVGALALDNSRFRRKSYSMRSAKKCLTMSSLFAATFNYAWQTTDATHFVIMVNPKHKSIYDFFGFKQFCEVRHYPRVNKPAVPMILDLKNFFSSAGESMAALFVTTSMHNIEDKSRYIPSTLDLAERIASNPSYFRSLSNEELKKLETIYPSLNKILKIVHDIIENQMTDMKQNLNIMSAD
jgi:hypothetical protein